MSELELSGMDVDNIQLELKIIKADQMNIYVYGGLNRFEATTNIIPQNTPAEAGDTYHINYEMGMVVIAYPNENAETDFEFRYKLIGFVKEMEEDIIPSPEEDEEIQVETPQTEPESEEEQETEVEESI